ncbi:MAG: YraN family protein [Pseudomonadota bacterium]
MSDRNRRGAGADAEQFAARWLRDRGLRLIARNHHCRFGELDLVMLDGTTLVVIEVRYRGSGARVRALESITTTKQSRIIQATRHLLMRYPKYARRAVRFDVLAIDELADTQRQVHWIKSAFDA